MKTNSFFFSLIFIVCSFYSFGQKWAEDMQKPDANFYEIQAEFEAYWSTHDRNEKGKGYKAFKRWEYFVEPRVYPSGNLSVLNQTAPNFAAFLASQNTAPPSTGKIIGSGNNMIASSTWTAMGPFGALTGNAGGQLLKSGRLGFITVHPTNTLNLWVGAPAGGLWKSTDGGVTWSTNTDQLGVLGCSDLAIDPSNTNIMYLATGDGDAGDTRSIGVLKSTNGGLSWVATGLTNAVTTNFLIRRLIINPTNTQIILAATNSGIYRTINGGSTWTQVITQSTYDLEFNPVNPNVIYAGGTAFRLSTDGGATFSQITSGLPSADVQRMAVAVTSNDANYVYVLASRSSNSGFLGLYRSVVGGTAFATMSSSTSINLMGWSNAGTDAGGQGWYDLALAASPLNKDEIVVGGVNVWQSIDGGMNWNIYGHWTGSGASFTHADQHDLDYIANGTLFGCNDGTVYKRVGSNWQEISGTMNISQIYRIGLSSQTANRWITGHQDNGTSIWTGTSYNAELGGDGMDCFIDRTNNQNCFGEYQNGSLQRSTNGGATWSGCTTSLTGTSPWLTVWKQDPQNATTLYVGRVDLFKSTNLAATAWTTLTPVPTTVTIREFAIAPSNNQIIYVLKSTGIYKTTDGGVSWSNVTGSVPIASALPEFIAINPSDPNNAWVVLGGYSSGNKVFRTTNGGASWTNFTGNLPNLPGNCIVCQPGTNGVVYVGMDVGVYYRDNAAAQWTLYNAGLPNVPIADLEISPASPSILYAATYGRGVWAVSLSTPAGAPLTAYAIPSNSLCVNAAVTFSDQSGNTPTAWSWSVSPSLGVSVTSPTIANPVFVFSNPGSYTIDLVAANASGQGTVSTQIVTVNSKPVLSSIPSAQNVCAGSAASYSAVGAINYTWSNGGGTANNTTYFPLSNTIYTLTGNSNNCVSTLTVSAIAYPLPTVVISGTNQCCIGDQIALTVSGAANYLWYNSTTGPFISVSPSTSTSYSVSGTDSNGCTTSDTISITVYPLPLLNLSASDSMICQGEEVILNITGATYYLWSPGASNATSITFSPVVTTTFSCSGVDDNGCMSGVALTVDVSLCEGLDDVTIHKTRKYDLFPNPTKGKVILICSDKSSHTVQAELRDQHSKLLFQREITFTENDETSIDLSAFASGTYLLKLKEMDGTVQLLKVLKE